MAENDDESRIRVLMGEIARACFARDVETLDRVFAEDFTFTDPGGPVVSKKQWISDIASGELTFESIESNAFELRQTAGIARVHGELTIRARYSKSNYNGTFRYLGVYMKQGDDWKLLVTSARPAGVQAQDGERHQPE